MPACRAAAIVSASHVRDKAERLDRPQLGVGLHARRSTAIGFSLCAVQIEDDQRRLLLADARQHHVGRSLEEQVDAPSALAAVEILIEKSRSSMTQTIMSGLVGLYSE